MQYFVQFFSPILYKVLKSMFSMRKKPKIAIYYRTSKKKNNIRMQRSVCRDYSKCQKLNIIKEYSDKGKSGLIKNRPAFKKMIDDLKNFDGLLVYKIDRLGRKFSYLNELVELLDRHNVKLISATQYFDYSTPEGRFTLRLLMCLAEYESGITSKRVKDGLKIKRRKK